MSDWQSGTIDGDGIRLHFTRTGGDKPPSCSPTAFPMTASAGRRWPSNWPSTMTLSCPTPVAMATPTRRRMGMAMRILPPIWPR